MTDSLKPYPEYKDSGVEWLGEVPAHWEVLPNRAVFTEVREREHPDEEMLSVTITRGVIRQRELLADSSKKDISNLDRSAYKLVRPGDIVYNKMRAWQGAIGVSDYRGIVSPAYVVQRPKPCAAPRYLHFLLRIPAFAKEAERWSYGITSDMWSLRPEHFKLIYSCVPPLAEQTAIVRFLDYVDRRVRRVIRGRRRLVKLLEEYKQALIHQAVTGRIDVRTGQPYPEYKDSGVEWLGEVPAHWDVLPLKFLSGRVQNGSTPPTSNGAFYHAGTVPWYGPSSCGYEEQVGKPVRLLNEMAFEAGVARLISAPAILLVVIGATAGRMALLNQNGATNQQITAYELNTRQVIPAFAIKQLRPAEYWLRGTASTATIPILNSNVVSRLLVALPPLAEQTAIVEYLDAQTGKIDRAIDAARREIGLLEEFRTRLIADVVTGKLDVREAAARLPEEPEEPEPPDDLEEDVETDEAAEDLDEIPEEAEA